MFNAATILIGFKARCARTLDTRRVQSPLAKEMQLKQSSRVHLKIGVICKGVAELRTAGDVITCCRKVQAKVQPL